MNNSEIHNEFPDRGTGITFLIPYKRQLQREEAEKIARFIIERDKEQLFLTWKSRKQNKDWTGDESAKKKELFRVANRSPEKLVIGDIDSILNQ